MPPAPEYIYAKLAVRFRAALPAKEPMLRFRRVHFARVSMYKGTRHTGQMWGYKSSSVHTSSFSSEAKCKAILARCKQTFVTELGILQAEDFYAMVLKMGSEKTKVMAVRLRRGKEHLRTFGIPDNLIFAAPKHLLIVPKLGGVLARLRRVNASRLPVELRDLHQHLNGMPEPAVSELSSASPPEKVLFRVSKDGTRTAFTATKTPDERRRNHIYGGTAPTRDDVSNQPPKHRERRREPQGDSTLAFALKDALSRKASGK
ncbi:hypothetical protein LMG23992_00371 [Cupriavidus laharis]|uniref:Uncharacterized protein n=1 Tax=Cupriavidus laharis TaxID=151654 RepID=A0ABM8WD42_9BURK|nr:hypothetical protein [Cupriavidus laharis]CAG9165227.1 hypothetical protein LMG23992_00371 [Cupriavidus laharis]